MEPIEDEVYYRVLVNPTGCVIACMQWFDEHDYDSQTYLDDVRYKSEEEAEKALNVAIGKAMHLLHVEGLI